MGRGGSTGIGSAEEPLHSYITGVGTLVLIVACEMVGTGLLQGRCYRW